MRGKILPDDDDPRHGTVNGYSNLGCRCDKCRAAKAADQRAQKEKRVRRGLPEGDPRHGKATTYTNWRCRCQACTKAWAEYRRAYQVTGQPARAWCATCPWEWEARPGRDLVDAVDAMQEHRRNTEAGRTER